MARPEAAVTLPTFLGRVADELIKVFVRLRFRYDIFLSYPRADATPYAIRLRDDLAKLDYEVFLDLDEAPAGASLSTTLRRALNRSAVLVIVGSPAAARSPYVAQEISHFALSGRDVLPINVGSVKDAEWGGLRAADQIWIDETVESLAVGQPSLGVVETIEKRFRYTRRNVRVRAQIAAAGAAFVLGAVLATFLLQREVRNADAARRQAQEQQHAAEAATAAANRERASAEASRAEALRQQNEAERSRAAADRASAEAQRRKVEAEAAAAQARQQQLIAQSRSLAAQAEQTLIADPTQALGIAMQSFRTAKTDEARVAIAEAFPRVLDVFGRYNYEVTGASSSPDGRWIVTTFADGTANVRDVASGAEPSKLSGHRGRVVHAVFSSDASRIVTVGADRTARVWETATGKQLAIIKGTNVVMERASFSPDGQWIVTVGGYTKVSVWNVATGELATTFEGGAEVMSSAEFSPAGDRIVSVGDIGLRVWRPTTGQELGGITFEGFTLDVHYATFIPDGQRIVVAAGSKAQVWTADCGRLLLTLHGHTDRVRDVAVSHDGQRIVTASDDRTARVWNAETGKPLATLRGHTDAVTHAAFSPDGNWIVSASEDRTARVWNARTGEVLAIMQGHPGGVTYATLVADGYVLTKAANDPTARLWTVAAGDPLVTLQSAKTEFTTAKFSPDGRRIATGTQDGTVGVFSGIDGQRLFSVHGLGYVRDVTFSPDGRRIAAAGNRGARVWDSTSGRLLFVLRTEIPSVLRGVTSENRVIFSADGRWIAVHLNDGTVSIWNAADGRQLAVLHHSNPGDIADVQRTIFSPDGKRALTVVRGDRTARIWNVGSGELLFMLGHGGPVTHGALSSDGRRVVTSSEDGKARAWDATTGRLLTTIEVNGTERVAFSPDGAVIVTTSGGRVKAWDPATGAPSARAVRYERDADDEKLSPDGKLVVTPFREGFEGLAEVRDVETRRVVVVLDNRAGRFNSGAFSSDGQRILIVNERRIVIYRILTLPDIAALLKR